MTHSISGSRFTRARLSAAVLVAALGFVLVLFALTRLPGQPVPLLTGNGYAGGGCYLNFLVDDLVVDPVNGTAVIEEYTTKDGPASRVLPIMWPPGYTARRSGSEVEVFAGSGEAVARTGGRYRLQGGYEGDVWVTCAMKPMLNWTPAPGPVTP